MAKQGSSMKVVEEMLVRRTIVAGVDSSRMKLDDQVPKTGRVLAVGDQTTDQG